MAGMLGNESNQVRTKQKHFKSENKKKQNNENTEPNGLVFIRKKCNENDHSAHILAKHKLVTQPENPFKQDISPSAWVKTMKIIIKSYANSEWCMKAQKYIEKSRQNIRKGI